MRRLDPVARLAAAVVIAGSLAWTIDPVSAGMAFALELALTPLIGVSWRRYWRRVWIVWAAAPLAGFTLLLYAEPSGRHWFDLGLIHVTDGSIALAGTMALRVLALALPAVTLFIGVDATELADSLAQHLRLPSRFVYGALGSFRLVETFREDWRQLALARRARGVADEGRLRRWVGAVFAMLVLAVRRGSALATAMEARGFGAPVRRTNARRAGFGPREIVLLLLAAGISAAAITASLLSGAWHPVVG